MTRPATVSNSSSDSSVWKYSLNSSIGVWPRTMYWRSPSLRMFMSSSMSCSSSMSPTICSMTSSMVTRPAMPPYSSATMAMCTRERRISRSSTLSRFDSGTNTGGRMNSLMSKLRRRRCSRQSAAQQVLGQQDADDLLAILVHHRKARVTALDHGLEQHLGFVVAIEEGHLRARHHDVAHLDVGDAEHAFEHRERVAFDDAAQRRFAQVLDDLAAILRLAGHLARQLAQPAAARADGPCPCPFLFFFGAHV